MSEQENKPGFMEELDKWTEATITRPLAHAHDYMRKYDDAAALTAAVEDVKYAVRQQVLQSYKNGCRAGAGAVRKELRRVQQ